VAIVASAALLPVPSAEANGSACSTVSNKPRRAGDALERSLRSITRASIGRRGRLAGSFKKGMRNLPTPGGTAKYLEPRIASMSFSSTLVTAEHEAGNRMTVIESNRPDGKKSHIFSPRELRKRRLGR
jgi:hypothetical protein